MNIIFLLIGFSILLALLFLLAFFWASKSGQNDDLYTPAVRILFDDHPDHLNNIPFKHSEENFTDPHQKKSDEDHSQV